jgi:hypothetical protein
MNVRDASIVGEAVVQYRKLILADREMSDGIAYLNTLIGTLDGELLQEYVRLTAEIDQAADAAEGFDRHLFRQAVNGAGRQA